MEFLGDKFIDKDGNELGPECIQGYKLIMIVHTASWCGGCLPFKYNLKEFEFYGDRDLLFQAYANLVDNSIKFTPKNGSIFIKTFSIIL